LELNENEIFVHVFFVDIVKLSDPKLGTTEEQTKKIEVLTKFIEQTKAYRNAKDDILINNTGDGAAICFKKNIRAPLELAIELHQKLRRYNLNKKSRDKIHIKIGINSGTVLIHKGIGNPQAFWGRGAINARRIMDIANSDNILLDSGIAKELKNLSNKYNKITHYVGNVTIKHEAEELQIYSAYSKNFGNKKHPNLVTDKIKEITVKEYGNLILNPLNKKQYEKQSSSDRLLRKQFAVLRWKQRKLKQRKMMKNKRRVTK